MGVRVSIAPPHPAGRGRPPLVHTVPQGAGAPKRARRGGAPDGARAGGTARTRGKRSPHALRPLGRRGSRGLGYTLRHSEPRGPFGRATRRRAGKCPGLRGGPSWLRKEDPARIAQNRVMGTAVGRPALPARAPRVGRSDWRSARMFVASKRPRTGGAAG